MSFRFLLAISHTCVKVLCKPQRFNSSDDFCGVHPHFLGLVRFQTSPPDSFQAFVYSELFQCIPVGYGTLSSYDIILLAPLIWDPF